MGVGSAWPSRTSNCNFFWSLGGSGDIYNSTSLPNSCNEPYSDLGTYTKKGISAWTEVTSGAWPSRTSIMTPEGRDLGKNVTFFGDWEGLVI